MRVPLLARLLRLGVHHLAFSREKAVVIASRASFLIDGDRVVSLGRLHGSRPMALCAAEGEVYYGEYRSNPERSAVSIYGLDFASRNWKPVWRFEGVRHIHGVFYDDYAKAFWVTTGDRDDEAAIWRSDDHFQTLHKVKGGNQQCRAVQLLFTPEHVYFGSDAPDEPNYIYRMERDGVRVERLAAVGGSVFYGCRVGKSLFFSTAVEPSQVNKTRHVEIWLGQEGQDWQKVATFRKDFWPMKYFQYGQVFFPSGDGDGKNIYCTPFATNRHGKTIAYEVD